MGFAAFERAIVAGPLREVARYWNGIRGARPLPAWSDMRPSKIAQHLPILWAWKYDVATDTFTGRLAGDSIEVIFGRSFRGATMEDLFSPAERDRIFARHKRVVTEPACFRGEGLVFQHLNRFGRGERIILPLAENGKVCDGLIGATVYETGFGAPPAQGEAAEEVEEWFALD